MKRSKGLRVRTRKLLRRRPRKRGHLPVTRFLQTFEPGERVSIVIEPSIHRGMPHRRFHGLTGTVVGTRGKAVVLKVRSGRSYKTVISNPVHLKKLK